MTRVSAKRASVNNRSSFATPFILLCLVQLVFQTAHARSSYTYDGDFEAFGAAHLLSPGGPQAERLSLAFEQKATFSKKWSGVIGFSAWDDSVYASAPTRYSQQLASEDSLDVRFREAFIQYKSDNFLLKMGNQQVVWGEAFGNFYSDIINPKDFRNGLYGDFNRVRLQIPMINSKVIFSKFSIQGIYIPIASFDILPQPGSDYFPVKDFTPFQSLKIHRELGNTIAKSQSEFGGRATVLLGGWDFSVFGFNHLDREPYYSINPATTATTLSLDEIHSRAMTYGATLTKDLGFTVLRFEGVKTAARTVPLLTPGSASSVKTDESIYVVGLDLPTISEFNFSAQWSQDKLNTQAIGLLRSPVQSLISFRIQKPLFRKHDLELIYTRDVADRGERAQLNYMIPISGSLESHFGVDFFAGPPESDFGRITKASRAYVMLKSYIKD